MRTFHRSFILFLIRNCCSINFETQLKSIKKNFFYPLFDYKSLQSTIRSTLLAKPTDFLHTESIRYILTIVFDL